MWNVLQSSINIALNKVTLKENQMISINVQLMGKKAKMYLFYSFCYEFMSQLIMFIPCNPRLYPFLCMDCFNLLLCIYQFQMVTSYNPGCQTHKCPECSPGVVYVQAKGDNDILHYVVSALGGPPTALVIKTNRPKERYQLNINCKMMASKNDTERKAAITLPSGLKEIYSYGVVFSRASINGFHWCILYMYLW